jgi:hypothetical protein
MPRLQYNCVLRIRTTNAAHPRDRVALANVAGNTVAQLWNDHRAIPIDGQLLMLGYQGDRTQGADAMTGDRLVVVYGKVISSALNISNDKTTNMQ